MAIPKKTIAPKTGLAAKLEKDLGIDISDIAKDAAAEYVKTSLFGPKQTGTKSKFEKTLQAISNFIRSTWWVFVLFSLSLGLVLIFLIYLSKMVGIN